MRIAQSLPGAHGGMMDGGQVTLYDDGTHGDHVPGDGLYCYEDFDGTYGCHSAGAATGSHHYDFYGIHDQGGETDHHLQNAAGRPSEQRRRRRARLRRLG